jgi:hypothetical protein
MEQDHTAATFGTRRTGGEGKPVGVDLQALDHPGVISRVRAGACCPCLVRL